GPPLVTAAVGEDVTAEEMGGSAVHTKVSGVADLEVADDRECLSVVRTYLGYLPSSNLEGPPRVPEEDRTDPADRRCEDLYDVVPANPRQAYDVRKVIRSIVDDGVFFPMKPEWARNLVTGFARFDGRPVGIVANQPTMLGGALDVNAADKAARFVWLCDAFKVRVVFLMDGRGVRVGSAVVRRGMVRQGGVMVFDG